MLVNSVKCQTCQSFKQLWSWFQRLSSENFLFVRSNASSFCTRYLLSAKTAAEGSSCFRGSFALPSLWGAGCLTHVPGRSAPTAAASAARSRQPGSDLWMCPDPGSGSEKVCSPCLRGSGSVSSSVKLVAFS